MHLTCLFTHLILFHGEIKDKLYIGLIYSMVFYDGAGRQAVAASGLLSGVLPSVCHSHLPPPVPSTPACPELPGQDSSRSGPAG